LLRTRGRDARSDGSGASRGRRAHTGDRRAVRCLCGAGYPARDEESGLRPQGPAPGAHAHGIGGGGGPRTNGGHGGEEPRGPFERAMTETTMMQTDLDLLAERVEKAAALVQRLKEDRQRLERELGEAQTRLQETERRLQDTERRLQGQDV